MSAALVQAVLPGLQAVYGAHRRTASPVSEGSVLEVLAAAQRDLAARSAVAVPCSEGSAEGLTRDAALGAAVRTGV